MVAARVLDPLGGQHEGVDVVPGRHVRRVLDKLQRRELDGIAIWRDENGNGISDAGEVKPLREWGIGRLETRGILRDGVLCNPRGALRGDGASLPTYDWTPRSLD